ncbi:MAG TPA: DUF3866 family protein [Solirubrobacterales bacterium]|nr:DUF3866 family protein [Solirubrobacterales bacterium]
MSGRLKLRRGVVVSADPLEVEVGGERRRAWADEVLLGEMREGDEVVVNVAALDLRLGSGGFDVVHVNLTRGLEGAGVEGDAHVMKLNYTSLQHPVEPVEGEVARFETHAMGAKGTTQPGEGVPVAVLPLHGHLAPAAWAAAQAAPGLRVGYVQTGGGALPGSFSRDVAELRERGLLCGHITAAPAYGGEYEAMSTVGALDAARKMGWDAILVGGGPGIIGSDTEFGHGGMAALESAHAALALKLPTLLSPRLSSSDPRERHLYLSHHTFTVLECLLDPVEIAVPEADVPGAAEARSYLTQAAGDRHHLRTAPVDLDSYAASGLPTRTMGRALDDDPLFFAAPLSAGHLLTELRQSA